ncbi:alpha-amylase family glycosyl hydrolase [Flavobacterium hibernum]|uniref:Alpha-amylase n=1 Tax=Flavobacterium hibernum TaxID=37752 RepID=A0A0D0EX78_9FLAO|nr:alpha-amylase family glycosyl hydrolase [Flavobacterium hibernum]KIO51781.1 alpha-amylase [Flavobacterium hibernum]OXA91817.1 alpha-amylase [Flavobacterium hibernum]STO19059.1 Beta/alpha-amylase precursor [Flavobacterium hibernum]
MKKTLFFYLVLMCCTYMVNAKNIDVYPTNWWVGMKTNSIQLLIRSTGEAFSSDAVTINYSGIKVLKTHQFSNKRYLALDILISPEALAGTVLIETTQNGKKQKISWPLNARRTGNGTEYAKGVTSADFIDLIMVDRFSNGDPTNDRVKGMRDQSLDRNQMYDRHGGDLQGVINNLDYLQGLGITALWFTPVMENDMMNRTEHGYAITDHYKIDARYGGDAKYKELSEQLHKRGMKLIFDAVYNHFGLYHFLEQDQPENDWVHRWPEYTQTNYREQPLFDPYGAKSDQKKMSNGWFDKIMPDINQDNPYMANFLIQNCIWHIETFGIDGVRLDTYTYNDLNFANRCNAAILNEYPKMTIFGEIMVHGVANQAYFEQNNIDTPFKSNLPSVVDFQSLYYGIIPALTQPFGWTDGVNKLYYTLSSDFLSKNAMQKVLLLDNHDEPRFFSVVGENVEKQKIGFQWLLTCRGIPQLYYGSEVLVKGFKAPDGLVRSDFPGGWTTDTKNAFTGKGLTEDEKSTQDLVRKLANFRKKSSALTTGKLMHYIPVDGLYVYFRYDDKHTIMCVMNTSDNEKEIDFQKYNERTDGFNSAENVVTNEKFASLKKTTIPAMKMWILELNK